MLASRKGDGLTEEPTFALRFIVLSDVVFFLFVWGDLLTHMLRGKDPAEVPAPLYTIGLGYTGLRKYWCHSISVFVAL